MKLSDFIVLDHEDKKCILLHEGILIGKRRTEDSVIFLFRLENFYVESVCDVDTKALAEVHTFTSDKLLQPYLEGISLEGIIE